MTKIPNKFTAGPILIVCLLLANVGSVFAAPIDAGQTKQEQPEQKRHTESSENSEKNQVHDSEEYGRIVRTAGNLEEVVGMIAEHLGVSVSELEMALREGPTALRELGIDPMAVRRVFMAVAPQNTERPKSRSAGSSAEVANMIAGRLGISVDELILAVQQRPEALRELKINPRALRRDFMDVLELTAYKLGVHPAKLGAAFRESAMELVLKSIGMKSRFGEYTDQDFKGYKPDRLDRDTEEDRGYGYNWQYKDAWKSKGYGHDRWNSDTDDDSWGQERSGKDGYRMPSRSAQRSTDNDGSRDKDEAQSLPIHNVSLAF